MVTQDKLLSILIGASAGAIGYVGGSLVGLPPSLRQKLDSRSNRGSSSASRSNERSNSYMNDGRLSSINNSSNNNNDDGSTSNLRAAATAAADQLVELKRPPSEIGGDRTSVHAGESLTTDPNQQSQTSSVYHSAEGGILNTAIASADARNKLPKWPIYRVCITGGPCSGKSSCMQVLKNELASIGFRVFVVPEVATLMINGGLEFSNMTQTKRIEQQRVILQTIMMLEDAFYELAAANSNPSILLCDRGTLDGSAYCSKEEFEQILRVTGYSVAELRDARYDAVVHLVTTAIGAVDAYTTINNNARSETPEQAADLDRRTREKWTGHRMIGVFDNSTTFNVKVNRVINFIKRAVHITDASAISAGAPLVGTLSASDLDHHSAITSDAQEVHQKDNNRGPLRRIAVGEVRGEMPVNTVVRDSLVLTLESTPQYTLEKIIRQKVNGSATLFFHMAERKDALDSSELVSQDSGGISSDGGGGGRRDVTAAHVTKNRITEKEFSIIRNHCKVTSTVRKSSFSFFYEEAYFVLVKYSFPKEYTVLLAPEDLPDSALPPFFTYEQFSSMAASS